MTKRPSHATLLVDLALETDVQLFHTPDAVGYVTIPMGDHRETWPLRGGPFRHWLARLYYMRHGGAAGSQALQDALAALEGKALFEGSEHDVRVRIAECDGAFYLDLVDDYWHAIQITAGGWKVVHDPPVRFRRARGMRPLPYPATGGDIDELREFANVRDAEWPLIVAWLVSACRPKGPFPVIDLLGEQGTAKSTLARMLRQLVDPNEAPLRSQPRSVHDLMITARNGWVVAFDNVSSLPPWLSDAICRLSTGGGFSTRELYSDTDETLIDVQRPVILNGIEDVATRGDLLDRCLMASLPQIHSYRTEDEFWRAFEAARPRIFGALLDAVVCAIDRLDDVSLERLPRMADFARWAVAAEPALGLGPGSFLTAYSDNRADARALTLEATLIAAPVMDVATNGFDGTATQLLAKLEEVVVPEETTRKKDWPKTPSRLSGELRRLAPTLRSSGILITFGREGNKRTRRITIRTEDEDAVRAVRAHADLGSDADAADGDTQTYSTGRFGRSDEDEIKRLAEVRRFAGRPLIGEPGYPLAIDADYVAGHLSADELREQIHLDAFVGRQREATR